MKSFLLSFISIDIRSLLAIIVWTNLVALSIPFSYYATLTRRGESRLPIPLFTLAKLCQIGTFSLLLLRPALPDLLSVYVANSLFFIGTGLESIACYQIFIPQKPSHTRNQLAAITVAVLFFCICEAVLHDPSLRIAVACFSVIIVLLPPGLHLLFTPRTALFGKVIGLFILIFVVIQAPRIINILHNRDLVILTNDVVESLTMLSLLLLNAVSTSMLFLTLVDSLHQSARNDTEEQRRAAEAAEKSSRIKSTFLAKVSHEIRTPMNGITGFAELALAEPGLSRKTAGHLNKILQSSQNLLSVVNDVLEITSIESGCLLLEKVPFSLHDVFAACDKQAAPKAREKNLTIYVYAEPFVGGALVGDPQRLNQILMHLLSNAIKFTNFGMIKLTAHVDEYRVGAVDITFEVKDSGIGMSRDELDRAFNSFSQGDNSCSRKYGGAGLGLAIAKGLVELMGGKLTAESTLGLGSKFTFSLTFPVIQADAAPAVEPPPLPPAAAQEADMPAFSGRVLVLEDNSLNQEVVAAQLEQVGVEYTLAANGKIGLEHIKARIAEGSPFDVIFMDIEMPVMGGIETAQALQAMHSQTPIVALTANVMPNDQDIYRRYGMIDFLAKPFQSRELWDVLAKYLPRVERGEAAPADAGGVEAVLNRETGLDHANGDAELYGRQLGNFIKYQADAGDAIAAALRKGDNEAAERRIHALWGVARKIGAERLSSAAFAVGMALESGVGAAEVERRVDAMDGELQTLLARLAEREPPADA